MPKEAARAPRYDDRGVNTFYLREGTWAFALRQWLGGAKFWLAQALIRAMGYPAIASKVWSGWLVRGAAPPTHASERAAHAGYACS